MSILIYIYTYFLKLLQLIVILLILYLPFFIFLFLTYKKTFTDTSSNIKPFALIILFALPVGTLFHVYIGGFNSMQLVTTLLVLVNVFFIGIVIMGLVKITEQFKLNTKAIFLFFLAFIFPLINLFLFYQYHDRYPSFSKEFPENYLEEIEKISKDKKQPIIACYINEESQRWYEHHLFTVPVAFPFKMNGKVNLVLINTHEQFAKINKEDFIQNNYSLYHFIQEQQKNDKFISTEISRIEFIKEKKIKILVVQANSNFNVPEEIISREIIDNISGEKVYLLKDKY